MQGGTPATEGGQDQPGMFTTTHWSVVLKAGQEDSTEANLALTQLFQTYWYPLYAYVRRRGYTWHDTEDVIQGFFYMLLRRQALNKVAKGRGKFRSFLVTALKRYLHDEHDRRVAQKRGGGQPVISLDAQEAEQRYRLEPPNTETPEKLLDRQWAMALIDGAIQRLQKEYVADNKGPLFEQLRGYIVEGKNSVVYAEVARNLGMTEEAVKKAAQRLRCRYRAVVREEVAQTLDSSAGIDEELRYLRSVL